MPSAPSSPGAPRNLTGLFLVTAPPVWMQVVVAPVFRAFHSAFCEVELKLRTATWRDGVRGPARPVTSTSQTEPFLDSQHDRTRVLGFVLCRSQHPCELPFIVEFAVNLLVDEISPRRS